MSTAETVPVAEARGRGRPREFDADEVLDRVVALFWEQGFEATSMSDLVEATGLNKSSLYNSFGSKDELFQTAVNRYVAMREGMLHELLRDGTAGLADVETFFEFARQEAGGEMARRGCLAVNTTTELGGREDSVVAMSAHYRGEIRTSFHAALTRAAEAGEIDADRVDTYAELLVAFMLSLSVFARGGADQAEIDRQFAAAQATVDSWRS